MIRKIHINYRNYAIKLYKDQISSSNLRPDFYRARSINYLEKIRGNRRRLNFIQQGFEPPINQRAYLHSYLNFKSGGFLYLPQTSVQKTFAE